MRRSLPLLVLLLATTASCGQSDRGDSSQERMVPEQAPRTSFESSPSAAPNEAADAAQRRMAAAGAGPDVAPTAAPGVAFNYRYAFRLAAPRIAEVQEQHAQFCERLTIARCRITGMLYRLVGPDDIEARLELKLDPAIARRFGRESVEAVVRAEGMLTESEISGIDVGTGIRAAGRSIAELTAELERIEGRLRAPNTSAGDKPQLDYQAEQLRAQIRALTASRDAQQETLATTPMVFRYGSGDLAPGFGQPPSLQQAAERAGENFLGGVNILLIVVVTLLPWAAAALLLWFAALFVRRRWFPKRPAATAAAAEVQA